jgi:hypothetical protein
VNMTTRHRLVLCMLGAAVVAAACYDDLTSPRHGRSKPGGSVVGPTASRSTINSPEDFVLLMGEVDPENGSAGTTMSMTYPYPTVVKMTSKVIINKTAQYHLYYWYNAYPDGTQKFHPLTDSYLGMTYQGINRTVSFTQQNGDDAVSFALIRAGETVNGAGRSHKSNEVWNPGCGPNYNQCYIYCGGWYPPSCFHFTGNPPSIEIERQAANMVMTVDSGGPPINTGSVVTFRVRPNVDTLLGYPTPYQIDTAAWTPDPDSLGGESSDAAVTGACTISGGNCAHTMVGSGTMRIVAHVNGKGFEASQHLGINDAHPILTAASNPAFRYYSPTDSVTFTATMSDGSTTTVTGWQPWVPDSGTAQTGTTCTGSLNPCRGAVRESGTMTVMVSYKGKTKHARVHVGLKVSLALSAEPNAVAPEMVVAFTPYVEHVHGSIDRWRWIPDDPASWDTLAGCFASTTCYRMMIESGTMWVYLGTDSASAYVTVSDGSGCVPSPSLAPTPHQVASVAHSALRSIVCSDSSGSGDGGGGGSGGSINDTLFLKMTSGVVGLPSRNRILRDSTVVRFHFTAPAGSPDTLVVTVDGVVRPSTDSFVMRNRKHFLTALLKGQCGAPTSDIRDTLRREYADDSLFRGTWMPLCSDFVTDLATSHFPTDTLYKEVIPKLGTKKIGIFESSMYGLTGVLEASIDTLWRADTVLFAFRPDPKINGTYRSPQRQHDVYVERSIPEARWHLAGRHMFGDAVDLGTDSVWTIYHALITQMRKTPGLTVLDSANDPCFIKCVHVDARNYSPAHY